MKDPHPFKERLLFTLLLGAVTGAAGILSSRAAKLAWVKLKNEPAPKPIGLFALLGAKVGVNAARHVG